MSQQAVTPAPGVGEPVSVVDDRLGQVGLTTKLLRRPELGALIGALAVGVFFAVTADSFRTLSGMANWTDVASTLGIMATVVSLLMIGGEFDLSAGVMTGTSGLLLGLLTTEWGVSMWPAILVTLAFAVLVGLFNGYTVMKTKLPSFIVTLATFFILQGVNLGFTKAITGTVRVAGLTDVSGFQSAATVFSSTFWAPHNFRISVLWWIAIAALATWVLARTRFGNWIFAVGGEANAARNVGVPVARVKISLFVITSTAAALVGVMIALRLGSVQAGQGIGEEFTYIIAAVVGGCLLTGGYGSAVGASLGALIVGMAFIGIQFSGWNTDWRFLFLGVILLAAVLVNNLVRKSAEGARK
jgi:simple sugar transport system permease protein